LTTVAGVALVFGLLVDRIVVTLPPQLAALPESFTAEASPIATMAAVALALLTINGLRVRYGLWTSK
jgi:hypothetical protein